MTWYKLLWRVGWCNKWPCRTITGSQRFQVPFFKVRLQTLTFGLVTVKWNIPWTNQRSEERVAATQVHLRRNQRPTAGRFNRIGHFLCKKKCKEKGLPGLTSLCSLCCPLAALKGRKNYLVHFKTCQWVCLRLCFDFDGLDGLCVPAEGHTEKNPKVWETFCSACRAVVWL